MNKLLSLALWLWLPIALDATLRCVNCEFELPGRDCVEHFKPCKIYVGDSCYKKTVYHGHTPIYFEKGCLNHCMPVNEPKLPWKVSEVIHCCANASYCNR